MYNFFKNENFSNVHFGVIVLLIHANYSYMTRRYDREVTLTLPTFPKFRILKQIFETNQKVFVTLDSSTG